MSISATADTVNVAQAEDNRRLAEVYRLLALALRSPVQGHIDVDFLRVYLELLDSSGLAGEAAELRALDMLDPAGLERLQLEHTRLFVNGLPEVAAPPYASFYLDGNAMLQGSSSGRALNMYRAHGFEPSNPAQPPDSIWLELEFLACLAEAGDLAAEAEFRSDYLRPWLPAFAQRIQKEARHPLYRLTIQLVDILTKEDE